MTVVREPAAGPGSPRRSSGRSTVRALSTVLIVSGLLLLADAVLTVVWQEPLSALYARIQQDKLDGQLDDLARQAPTVVDRRALAELPDGDSRLAFAARSLDRRARAGQPIGRIRIPRVGLSKVVVEGTGTDDLKRGPGHYPATVLPGAPGTVGIAGHRTTYGAPFRRLDKLRRGDRIAIDMPYGTFTYRVERTRIVAPTATEVVRRVGYDRLVLTACHPLYSAAQRIVVFARQVNAREGGGLI
ncbi:MAG TPA: class E sortase [Solirubrobacteraceae bacterium]|nr:class E sortase [Solirubrobacteraceae bacterium]